MTTKLTLAQCPRCRQYTLAGDDGGFAVAVDVAPMGRDAYIAGLMGGVELYRVDSVPGRPSLARTWSPGGKDPSFDDSGAQRGTEGLLHRAHGCGAPAKSQKAVAVARTSAAPVCDTWRAAGWVPPPGKCPRARGNTKIVSCATCEAPPFDAGAPETAPKAPGHPEGPQRPPETPQCGEKEQEWTSPTASAARPGPAHPAPTAPAATKPSTATASPANTASAPSASTADAWTPPPSGSYAGTTASGAANPRSTGPGAEAPPVLGPCNICGRRVQPGQSYWSITHGRDWVDGGHEECP